MSKSNPPFVAPKSSVIPEGFTERVDAWMAAHMQEKADVYKKYSDAFAAEITKWKVYKTLTNGEPEVDGTLQATLRSVYQTAVEVQVRNAAIAAVEKELKATTNPEIHLSGSFRKMLEERYITPCLVALQENPQVAEYTASMPWMPPLEATPAYKLLGATIGKALSAPGAAGIEPGIKDKFMGYVRPEDVRASGHRLRLAIRKDDSSGERLP